jgi:hypothetical protein
MTGSVDTGKRVAPSLQALDAAWYTGVLRAGGHATAAVATAVVEPMSYTGAVADKARVRLRYDGNGWPGPASLIAKIRGAEGTRAAMDAAMGLYAREARFYTDFAPRVPLRTPRCYHAGDGTVKPLLLEDLGGYRAGDQMVGLSVNEARKTMDALGDLHARFWEQPEADADWLVAPATGVYADMVVHIVGTGFDALRRRYHGQVPDAVLDAAGRLSTRWRDVLTATTQGPQTFVHNDTRQDNLFFDADDTPIFVDWQNPARSRGTQDVANLLAGSMNTPELSEHWEALLRRYHDRLVGNGVRHYSFDDCRFHYRQNILYPLGAGIALLGSLDIGDNRGLGDAINLRALRHCAELDAFASV